MKEKKNKGYDCAQVNEYEREMDNGTPKRLALTMASDKTIDKGK
jgi:hypothetical protein